MSSADKSSILRDRIIARAWEDPAFRASLADNPQLAIESEARALFGPGPVPSIDQETVQIALAPPVALATEPNDLLIFWRKLFSP